MHRCALGQLEFEWEYGHPLTGVLKGHLVHAIAWYGGSATFGPALELDLDEEPGVPKLVAVGRFTLLNKDRVLHIAEHCMTAATGVSDQPGPLEPANTVTFWLARLHHGRLHQAGMRRADVEVRCPTCGLEYFATSPAAGGSRAASRAVALLGRECPDHPGAFHVPTMPE